MTEENSIPQVTSRKLASVQIINNIEEIKFINKDGIEETASSIVKASVLGWHLVTGKDNGFSVDDKIIYFECDSILPRKEWSEFLVDQNRPEKPLRIKTRRMCGQVSQGLILPLSILESYNLTENYSEEGFDLTTVLGIEKWEPKIPACLSGIAKGNFPSFLRKTNSERYQNNFNIISEFSTRKWYSTVKENGTSGTFYYNNGVFGVCSRNLDLKESENAYWKIANKLDLENKLKSIGKNTAFHGEIVGEGIQGNHLKIKGIQYHIFDIFDIDSQRYYNYNELLETVNELELQTVPVYGEFEVLPFKSVDEGVEYATIKDPNGVYKWIEGIVFRPKESCFDYKNNRVEFKIINPEYLLAYGE